MKLFLASSLDKMKDQLLAEVGSLQGKKIAYCINPADESIAVEGTDIRWLKNDRDMFIDCGAELMPIDLRVLQGEELKLVLESCDMIYVSGGENAYFLSVAKQSGYSDFISDLVRNQNKVYMSTSAGSCVMGSLVRTYAEDGSLVGHIPGYGFYQTILIPHRGGGSVASRAKYLSQMGYMYDTSSSFLTLTDYQAIIVDDHGMRILTAPSE